MNVFLAGASGAIGRRLIPLLRDAGHAVTGTTRSAGKAADLTARGITAVVVDVFDAQALRDAVMRARPEVVIHQLTDLPQVPDRSAEVLARNSRLRIEGTPNLVAAARAAGATRLIAQSVAFAYADGPEPHREDDALASGEGGAAAAACARSSRRCSALPASRGSCCAMVGSTVRPPGTRRRSAADRCTWTRPRMRLSSRSREERPGSTTLPRRTARSRSTGPSGTSASIRPSGCRPERLAEKPRALEPVAPRLIDRLGDADARPDRDLHLGRPSPQLEWRRIERQSIVRPADAERLAYPTGARAQQSRVVQAPPAAHFCKSFEGFDRPDQHRAGAACGFAHEVDAPMDAVGAIHIGKEGWAEHQ